MKTYCMMTLSSLETAEATNMRMIPDDRDEPMKMLQNIPVTYTQVTLPDHVPQVTLGNFGMLLQQWKHAYEYIICINHFSFHHPTTLVISIGEPCTCFYFPVRGSSIFRGMEIGGSYELSLEEGTIIPLKFNIASDIHRMDFNAGTFISIQISIPDRFSYLLDSEDWIWKLLDDYDRIIYRTDT